MDGSELTWHTYGLESAEGQQNTATYTGFMDMFESFTVQGNQGTSLVEGAISITFSSFTGPLVDCPCEFEGDITYWTSTSMFGNVLTGSEASIIVLEAEQLGDGTYRLSGTAEGELLLYESVTNPEPSGDPVTATLSFTVDRVVLEELNLD